MEKVRSKNSDQSMVGSKLLFEKNIWTIDDVASYLGLTKKGVYGMTSRGAIPHIKKRGNRLYFLPNDIQNWLEEGAR